MLKLQLVLKKNRTKYKDQNLIFERKGGSLLRVKVVIIH